MYGNHSMYICMICMYKHMYEYVGRYEEIYHMLCWCVHIVFSHSKHVRAHSPGSPWLKNKQTNHSLYYLLSPLAIIKCLEGATKMRKTLFLSYNKKWCGSPCQGRDGDRANWSYHVHSSEAEGRQEVVSGSSTSRPTPQWSISSG